MGWLDRLTHQVEDLREIRQLQLAGHYAEAGALVERVCATSTDSRTRADALLLRLAVLQDAGRFEEYRDAVEVAFAAVRELDEPYLFGHLHAMAALVQHHSGALESCVTHLVTSARYLARIEDPDTDTAIAWHDLAVAYSRLDFHGHALGAIERAAQISDEVGLPPERLAAPSIRLRCAVALDHRGDTEGCQLILSDLAEDLNQLRRGGRLTALRPIGRVSYGYALARLAALGGPSAADTGTLLSSGPVGRRSLDLRRLGEACLAIAAGRPIEALSRISTTGICVETLGPSEVYRVRSLAYGRAGDHAAAHQADRRAFQLSSQQSSLLHDVFVEGIAARLAHEELRRTVDRYADEALTDPLTGLPNRRHLERYVENLVARGSAAVIGVCDLDGFKAINTIHGHLSGDLVLQRVAGVLARVLRDGAFVARYGGDEFVVVLPDSEIADAAELSQRIAGAVSAEDWPALVPGTPVGVTVGWAEVSETGEALRTAILTAFETADRAMLSAKTRPRPRQRTRSLPPRLSMMLGRAAGED